MTSKKLILLLVVNSFSYSIVIPDGYKKLDCQLKPISRPYRSFDEKLSRPKYPMIPSGRLIKRGFTSSSNWCGYAAYLPSKANHSVTKVVGTWVVPAASRSSFETYCSIWVGIDGFNSDTVEQLGVDSDYYSGANQLYAWMEMYPAPSEEIIGFPVRVGDTITAEVDYVGKNTFVLSIVNHTRKVSFSARAKSSTASRSCAEWVVEAPWSGSILPLAHFTPVRFFDCNCVINNKQGAVNSNFWHNDNIRMINGSGATKANASSLSGSAKASSFFATWSSN